MKQIKISTVTVTLLEVVVSVASSLPFSGSAVLDGLVDAVGGLAQGLADAGDDDSDGGRVLSSEETRRILDSLTGSLDATAAQIPEDAVSIRIPGWSGTVLGAIGLLLRGDGLVGVVGAAIAALGAACRDGEVDAAELRAVIASIRAAAVD